MSCGQPGPMPVAVVPLTDPHLAYEINRRVGVHETPDIPFPSQVNFFAALGIPTPAM
jgi:hypothetical protein